MVRTQKLRRTMAAGLIAALMFGTVGTLPAAAKDKSSSALQVPVSGTTSTGGTFQGTATITGFAVDGQNVVAIGTIAGIVNGNQSIFTTFTVPVAQPSLLGGIDMGDVLAVQLDAARGRRVQAAHQVQQRALAGAGGADDRQRLAGADVEVDAVQHGEVDAPFMEALGQPADLQHHLTHSAAPPPD